ncbi:putative polyA binding protein cytoplasmic 1, partial [Baffinella frigidus]
QKILSLYVGNIKESFTEIGLYYLFSEIGPVDSVKLCRNMITGKHIGFGYIDFKNKQDAKKVIENIDLNSNFKNLFKPIKIMWKDTNDSLRESGYCNIFVKNLSSGFDLKDLFNLFISFGQILSSKIALDDNRKSLEFGFVNFENQYSADHAIEKINGKKINGKKIFVGPFIKKENFNLIMQKKKKKKFSKGNRKFTNIYIKNL